MDLQNSIISLLAYINIFSHIFLINLISTSLFIVKFSHDSYIKYKLVLMEIVEFIANLHDNLHIQISYRN